MVNARKHTTLTPKKNRQRKVSVQTDCPKPGFEIVLKESHLHDKYRMTIPTKLQKEFPSCPCNVTLCIKGKKWHVLYNAEYGDRMTFDRSGWKKFAMDNRMEPLHTVRFVMVKRGRNSVRFEVKLYDGGEEGTSMLSPLVID